MGRNPHMTKTRRSSRAAALAAVATLAGGCAAFGGGTGSGEEPREPSPSSEGAARSTEPVPIEAEPVPAPGLLEARLRAGDYDGVLAAYAADSTLQTNEAATYRAAIAAAMTGHEGYDPRLAAMLFERLLREHPDTPQRREVELYLDMLARERDLRAMVGRLDRELKQLKAIDLGKAPEDGEP